MDVLLIDELDVLHRAVVALQQLHVVFLDADSFLDDAVVRARDPLGEELLPLRVGKRHVVQELKLLAEIRDELLLGADGEVLVGLRLQLPDELLLQCCLGLVAAGLIFVGHILRNDGALRRDGDRVVLAWGGVSQWSHRNLRSRPQAAASTAASRRGWLSCNSS